MRGARTLSVAMIVAFLIVTGCAKMNYRVKSALKGTAAGIGVGCMAGGIGAANSRDKNRFGLGLGIGCASGALVGGILGYVLAKEPKAAPPPPMAPRTIVLDDVLFDFDRAVVKPDAKLILNRLVTFLQENPGRTVQLSGYTDSVGTDQYNLRLSLRRAKAVERHILERTAQVGATGGFTIISEGFGEANPIASNTTAEGRAQNRRVEVVAP